MTHLPQVGMAVHSSYATTCGRPATADCPANVNARPSQNLGLFIISIFNRSECHVQATTWPQNLRHMFWRAAPCRQRSGASPAT